ncbi:MAG: hypothetical protein E7256_10715 [Lachnospiraceae bacterium]|nr:hypothetical protein [Lachnospiraceae bacterium]
MRKLETFIEYLTGEFDNRKQVERKKQQDGKDEEDYPFARHVSHVCNESIENLPDGFDGYFLLEESYYTTNKGTNALPHLFLFTEEDGRVKLTSYEMPEGFTKETFAYENLKGPMDYQKLKVSETFTPVFYEERNGAFRGSSVSMFSPALKFSLSEEIRSEVMLVSEIFEVNGKRTFGYDEPIEYRRCKEQ